MVSDTINYFLSLFSIKSLVFEAACLTESNSFLLFWLESDQKFNSDEAYNFENNINILMINWIEEKSLRFRIWLNPISLFNTACLKQQKEWVIPQTKYCLLFEVARLGEKQILG